MLFKPVSISVTEKINIGPDPSKNLFIFFEWHLRLSYVYQSIELLLNDVFRLTVQFKNRELFSLVCNKIMPLNTR